MLTKEEKIELEALRQTHAELHDKLNKKRKTNHCMLEAAKANLSKKSIGNVVMKSVSSGSEKDESSDSEVSSCKVIY